MNIQGWLNSIGMTLIAVFFVGDLAEAQQYYQPECTTVDRDGRRCAETQCYPQRPARIQSVPPQRAGAFVAAPQSGEVVGEATGFGIRGMALTLPAVTLELPSIRLPSCFKTRRDAHMRVDASTAPFVQGQPAVFGQIPGRFQAERQAQSQAQQPDCDRADPFIEDDRCTSEPCPSSSQEPPPLPAAEDLGALTPREKALLLRLLEERKRVARLELQMLELTQAVEGNLHALQDENSLFESSERDRQTPQPLSEQTTIEHPWASPAGSRIQPAQYQQPRYSPR